MKRFFLSYSNHILLFISLAVSFPLLFENALEHSFPMGYAGLFTQMSKQIADANFRLPMESPFYGPGGIPFAYPPFGLYLLAILIKLTGKYFIFLRLLPPLLSLISLIPLFYLTLELSKSPIAAMFTVFLTATSQDLYVAHTWAAGIVRAPAFILALTSLYFFSRHLNTRSQDHVILTGVFMGLAFMSHLMYGLFCFLWIWWWTLFNKNAFASIKDSMISSVIGFLTVSIWLVPIFFRHGIVTFINAFNSHGGESTLSFWQNLQGLFNSFWINIDPVTSSSLLSVLVSIGILTLLVKRESIFPLFYLFIILVFPEGARFIFLIGCLFAGIGLSALVDWASAISKGRLQPLVITLLLVPVFGIIWWNGFRALSRNTPLIDNATLYLADYVHENMPSNGKYLALMKQDEAEWMPFLFQHQPLVSQWGSEWLGAYNEQTYLTSRFNGCRLNQDWSCVESIIEETGDVPDYVITYVKNNRLNQEILSTNQWMQIYANEIYTVWSQKTDLGK